MKVLVPGCTGLIGTHVLARLRARGLRAVGTSRALGVDLRDPDATIAWLAENRPDAVINCAAHTGSLHHVMKATAEVLDDNLRILLNLYIAASKLRPMPVIVNPISNCSYPGDLGLQKEEDWLSGPIHESVLAFAASRRIMYALSECYRRQHGLRSVNWLVPNTYGPGGSSDPEALHALNGLVVRLILSQQQGREDFEIWGSGMPIREWIYVEDVAEMLIRSVLSPPADQVYPVNLGQGKGYSIKELVDMIAACLQYQVRLQFNTQYPDGAPCKILDNCRFTRIYGVFPFTAIEEGIRRTVAYYSNSAGSHVAEGSAG